tara:strand:- start:11452 stop:12357 length:906 start_codon:yes stop_codon:yes gene_type:complete
MNWLSLIEESSFFWQYPVCTEKQFCKQNNLDENFIGFPWATVIDKKINLNEIYDFISTNIDLEKKYYTSCQHIFFRSLKNIFEALSINLVYSPHKIINEDKLGDIDLLPCPLYAVNIEDDHRNSAFKNINLSSNKRDLLFSFYGGYQGGYLTDIRPKIFQLPSSNDYIVKNTGDWHFNESVYNPLQNNMGELNESEGRRSNTETYNQLLIRSRFSLCPSGSGPNSIRLWESLGAGSIPVLLADTLQLPKNELWERSILRMKECDIQSIPDILRGIGEKEETRRRELCLELYNFYRDNYKND